MLLSVFVIHEKIEKNVDISFGCRYFESIVPKSLCPPIFLIAVSQARSSGDPGSPAAFGEKFEIPTNTVVS